VPVFVALLHSIIMGPSKRLVMADLKAIATEAGFLNAQTLAATGNLVMEARSGARAAEIETALEEGIARRFGKHIDVIARSAEEYRQLHAGNPFPDESRADASRVCVRVQRSPLAGSATEALNDWRGRDERVALVRGDLWISFGGKPSQSRLFSRLTTRHLGIGTSRNWNTVCGLARMLDS
jgi:uncharacterized protein (DUF1697 family)